MFAQNEWNGEKNEYKLFILTNEKRNWKKKIKSDIFTEGSIDFWQISTFFFFYISLKSVKTAKKLCLWTNNT